MSLKILNDGLIRGAVRVEIVSIEMQSCDGSGRFASGDDGDSFLFDIGLTATMQRFPCWRSLSWLLLILG